jgi:dTMP kinase
LNQRPLFSRARFITVEGIDGAGKTTHLGSVRAALERRGIRVAQTREPGGTALGERLRDILLEEPMGRDAEALLMFAARREHLEKVIWPALADGMWVLCDRFTDATFAYQGGGRGLALDRIAALESWVHGDFQPDLTLLFDVPVAVGRTRVSAGRDLDRFEREESEFFERVRAVYLQRVAADSGRFRVIDSTRPLDVVRAEIEAIVESL